MFIYKTSSKMFEKFGNLVYNRVVQEFPERRCPMSGKLGESVSIEFAAQVQMLKLGD